MKLIAKTFGVLALTTTLFSCNLENNIVNQNKLENKTEIIGKINEISDKISYKIYKVVDGDTIKIFNENGEKQSIRFVGVDTPESYKIRFGYKECFGDEASDYLKDIVGDSKMIQFEIDKTQGNNGIDRYGRPLGYFYLDGENLNKKMIEDGYGWENTYKGNFYKYQKDFRDAEKRAKDNNLGLWQEDTCNGERRKAE